MDSAGDLPKTEVVVFEDYLYYAALQRQEEKLIGRQISNKGPDRAEGEKMSWFARIMDVTDAKSESSETPSMTEDELERANASRAARITSWISAFYLLTTDILGPFSIPYAFSQLGWVPGIMLCFFSSVHSYVFQLLHTILTSQSCS